MWPLHYSIPIPVVLDDIALHACDGFTAGSLVTNLYFRSFYHSFISYSFFLRLFNVLAYFDVLGFYIYVLSYWIQKLTGYTWTFFLCCSWLLVSWCHELHFHDNVSFSVVILHKFVWACWSPIANNVLSDCMSSLDWILQVRPHPEYLPPVLYSNYD